ncbi:MAG: cyclic nucleotide-binding domain-containing protein [Pseudomonadales bacterium]|jgi:CRP-like cAMP-binding protein|nr:cyclic nucleotide-binding domain-containing protein [Pseudomonadales bacterium]
MSATAMNMDVIRRCPLFKLLDDEQFAHIEPRLQIIKLAAGEILYSEGAPADTVSIVTEGALEAIKMSILGGEQTVLSEFGVSDVIGEIALLSDRKRSASIRAQTPTTVASFQRAVYGTLERQRPDIALAIMKAVAKILAERLQDTSADLADVCA